MIRKAIIVVLALAAGGTVFLSVWTTGDRYLILWHASPHEWIELRSDVGRISLSFQWKRRLISLPVEKCWGLPARAVRPAFMLGLGTIKLAGVEHNRMGFRVPARRLGVVSILLALYPAVAFIQGPLRRWRRRRRGLCLSCGYNLTGNVSGICSECGTEIKPP